MLRLYFLIGAGERIRSTFTYGETARINSNLKGLFTSAVCRRQNASGAGERTRTFTGVKPNGF